MRIELTKKPKNPVIIEGFPGFGLVATIATEFLIDHLKTELIGEFVYDDLPAMAAIHNGDLIKPMAVHYSKKYNLIILQTILNPKGKEWAISDAIIEMANKLKAEKIISIEGVAGPPNVSKPEETNVYFHGDEKLAKLGLNKIDESIIVGVTACMMLRFPKSVCLFAETQSALPDSKAAARIIELLDKYLDLKVDYKPLLKQAEDFEKKLKGIIQKSSDIQSESEKKYMSYLG